MNVTLDDSSPQLEWFGNWTSWRDPKRDPNTPKYYRGTFHETPTEADIMRVRFNGTGAWIYGAFALNHGSYSVRTDGGVEGTYMGYAPERTYNQLLYYTGGLSKDKEHVVEITNRPSRTGGEGPYWLDIDYVIVELPIPDNLTTTIIDDSADRITYSPGFSPKAGAGDGYYNATAHQATASQELFTLPFIGSSIQLFGTISPDTGNFSISVDGNEYSRQYNGTWHEKRTNSPLFFVSGLSDSEHSITLTNRGIPSEQALEFDYAVVNSSSAALAFGQIDAGAGGVVASGPPTNAAGDNPSSPTGSSISGGEKKGGPPVAPIIGGIIGALGLIVLCVLGWMWWSRRRQERDDKARRVRAEGSRLSSGPSVYTGSEVKPYTSFHGEPRRDGSGAGPGILDDTPTERYAYGQNGTGGTWTAENPQFIGYAPPANTQSGRTRTSNNPSNRYISPTNTRPSHQFPLNAPSASEYSGTTEKYPGFAFLTSPPPPLPNVGVSRDSPDGRPTSPGNMSAYTGYVSEGPDPDGQARAVGRATDNPAAFASSIALPSSSGEGTSTSTSTRTGTWSGNDEKAALRANASDPTTVPGEGSRPGRPYTDDGLSPVSNPTNTSSLKEALLRRSRFVSGPGSNIGAVDEAGSGAGHGRGRSMSTLDSPETPCPTAPPPGYAESMAAARDRGAQGGRHGPPGTL